MDNFIFRKDRLIFEKRCVTCIKEYKKEYYIKNKHNIKQKSKSYYESNNSIIKEKQFNYNFKNKNKKSNYDKKYRLLNLNKRKESYKKYKENNAEKVKIYNNNYKIQNKDKLNEYMKNYMSFKRKDLKFKLKSRISNYIYLSIKNKKESIFSYLPYSLDELIKNIESKFEYWMSWSNWGKYNSSTWNDEDSSTWVWNIDHIIPHSTFNYKSFEDEDFKKCWSLDNLRPYSAKQNILDGSSKVRHKKEKEDSSEKQYKQNIA